MMDLTTIIKWVESGKQIGIEMFSSESQHEFAIGVAIQKYKSIYKICHYKINAKYLFSDDGECQKIEIFEEIDKAVLFLQEISNDYKLNIEDFRPFKGAKMFNPEFD